MFTKTFLDQSVEILRQISPDQIDGVVDMLRRTRDRGGRVFFCGSGGGAGHASHATCDFRKLAAIECYSVTDNVSELTARINDEGWDTSYSAWLATSRLERSRRALRVLRRWRRRRTKHQRQPRQRHALREGGRRRGHRHRRPRRRRRRRAR